MIFMKKKDINKLRQLSVDELGQKTEELERELVKIKMDKALGKLKDVKKVAKKRKEIAIVKTIISEKRTKL